MKKILFIVLLLSIAIVSFLLHQSFKEKYQITIFYTNDLQGFIFPHEEVWVKGHPLIGGSAYLATYIKKARAVAGEKGEDLFFLDAGDFFQGTPEGNFFRGHSMIEIMNAIGYDAMTVGDRDFAFGEENLRGLAKKAKFPFLGANIINEATGEMPDYVKPYIIKDYGKIKVGVIGITTPLMENYTLPENIKGLTFLSPIPVVKKYVSLLKEKGVNLIVVLSHMVVKQDKELAREAGDINIIIGNNDDKDGRYMYIDPIHKTIMPPNWEKGVAIFILDLTLDDGDKIAKYRSKYVDLHSSKFKPDSEVQAIVEKCQAKMSEKMKEVIGYAEKTLYRSNSEESSLGNWVADVMRDRTGVDIAFCAGLQADLKKGEITIGDVYNILPILNGLGVTGFNLAIVELLGKDIKNVLEHSVGGVLDQGRDIIQVSGLKMAYDSGKSRGSRVVEVKVDGKKLDLDKLYKVAVNGYIASGGDRDREYNAETTYVSMELSGRDIKNVLERGVGSVLRPEQKILQVSGLRMVYDPGRPQGSRVIDMRINGKKLDLDKIYKAAVNTHYLDDIYNIAANSYIDGGVKPYYKTHNDRNRRETGVMVFNLLVEDVKRHSRITAPLGGRIVRIDKK